MIADRPLPRDYPQGWENDVALRDGTTVRVRPILPGDADSLQHMLTRMSRQTVYHRFFQVKTKLEPEELEAFTHLDYEDRMAFVAIRGEEIVGVGRYWRDDTNPEIADVAFAVIDAEQGKGIATRLVRYLTAYADLKGITAFRASVLADNHVMIRVFRNAGYPMRRRFSGLSPTAAPPPPRPP